MENPKNAPHARASPESANPKSRSSRSPPPHPKSLERQNPLHPYCLWIRRAMWIPLSIMIARTLAPCWVRLMVWVTCTANHSQDVDLPLSEERGPEVELLPDFGISWIAVLIRVGGDTRLQDRGWVCSVASLCSSVWPYSPLSFGFSKMGRWSWYIPSRSAGYVSSFSFFFSLIFCYLRRLPVLLSVRLSLPLLSPLSYSSVYFSSKLFYFPRVGEFETPKMNFKSVLCNDSAPNDRNGKEKIGGAAGAAYVDLSTSAMPSPMTGNGNIGLDGEARKEIDMATFMSKLASVNLNIQKLKDQSLLGFVTGKTMELSKLVEKLILDWTFLHGDFHFFPKENGWFEIRFANPADKKRIWEGRPFHVYSQLLLLKPWKASFDATTESVTKLDMWIRILQLPAEYMSPDVLKTIVEMNQIGDFIKVDPYTARGANICYPRICVCAETEIMRNCKVMVPDEEGKPQEYKVWSEEFSTGCGFCGAEEHLFEKCELQLLHKKANEALAQKARAVRNRRPMRTNEAKKEEGEWTRVTRHNKWKQGNEIPNKKQAGPEHNQVDKPLKAPNDEKMNGMEADLGPSHSLVQTQNKGKQQIIHLIDDLEVDGDPEQFGDLTPQEMELLKNAPLSNKNVKHCSMNEESSYNSFRSLASNNSTVKKLQNLAVIPYPSPSSESGHKREGEGTGDTATSNLKGSGAKRMRYNE